MADDEIVDVKYVENTWDCTSCKARNPGRDTKCKNCGSPKDKSEHYNDADPQAPAVTDPRLLKQAKAGANRICPFCKSDNRALENVCPECGATLVEQAGPVRPSAPRRRPTSPGPFQRPTAAAKFTPRRFSKPKLTKTQVGAIVSLSLFALGSIVGGLFWLLKSHKENATVYQTSWAIYQRLDSRYTQHESGWGSSSGAFNVSCERRLKGHVDCNPHDCRPHQKSYECRPHNCNCSNYSTTENLNNGYSRVVTRRRCDTCYDSCTKTVYDTCYDRCPEYDDWCEYDHYAWKEVDSRRSTGSGKEIQLPGLTASGDSSRVIQTENFLITFTDGTKMWKYSPKDRTEYLQFTERSLWEIEVNHAGSVTPLRLLR